MKNMENLTPTEINLDFYNKKMVTVNAKQYDKHSRYLLVTCYNQGTLFLLNNASYSAYIRYKKADELSVFQSCEITDDGKILIELTEQMLLVAGTCMADLLLVDEGTLSTDTDIPVITNDGDTIYISENSILSTMNFYINVSSSPLQNQDIESTSEFSALNDMLEKVHDNYAHVMENAEESADKAERFMAQASKKADESDQSAKLSQSYAVGTNNEAREEDAVDNAKYYYEQSKQIQDEVHKVADGDLLINTASFTEADSRENIESGETLGTLFGKIKKWFSSLGTAAFHNVSNSLTQTSDGYVADARAVNSLATRVGELNDLATATQDSIVGAIDENHIEIEKIKDNIKKSKDKFKTVYLYNLDGINVNANGGTTGDLTHILFEGEVYLDQKNPILVGGIYRTKQPTYMVIGSACKVSGSEIDTTAESWIDYEPDGSEKGTLEYNFTTGCNGNIKTAIIRKRTSVFTNYYLKVQALVERENRYQQYGQMRIMLIEEQL